MSKKKRPAKCEHGISFSAKDDCPKCHEIDREFMGGLMQLLGNGDWRRGQKKLLSMLKDGKK